MKEITEADIEDYLHKRVAQLGGEHRRVKWIGRDSAPDDRIMGCKIVLMHAYLPNQQTIYAPTRTSFWVECKRPGYKVTPRVRAQRREHERMRALGETVYVFDSFESIDAVLGKPC